MGASLVWADAFPRSLVCPLVGLQSHSTVPVGNFTFNIVVVVLLGRVVTLVLCQRNLCPNLSKQHQAWPRGCSCRCI